MDKKHVDRLLRHLIKLAEDVSMGQYGRHDEIFELTKTGRYPPLVTKLAEAFGMMIVKIEAREFRLEQVIDDLKKIQAELTAARERLDRENVNLKHNLRAKFSPGRILGKSRAILGILDKVEKVADTPVNVLLTGESGTGKELIAKSLHYNSGRSGNPFIAINCSAIPETLFECELFGIEKGVATGVDKRTGKIEQAEGGTLFLDEIGDMPLTSQAKVLRIIEEREVERVGGRKALPVDIRIIAATNKDIKKEIGKGNFREDLYYRLNVVQLNIPPLRERKDDILLLLDAFLGIYTIKLGKQPMRFSAEAVKCLKDHPWPGNVRELENEVERAVALSCSDLIGLEDLSEEVREHGAKGKQPSHPGGTERSDKELVEKALRESNGNKSEAARRLGLSREGLRKKLRRLEIG